LQTKLVLTFDTLGILCPIEPNSPIQEKAQAKKTQAPVESEFGRRLQRNTKDVRSCGAAIRHNPTVTDDDGKTQVSA
jgi:hypothetical protein